MSEPRSQVLSLFEVVFAFIGAIATLFSCLLALIVLVNPSAAQRVIIEFYNASTSTPNIVYITQPPQKPLPTYTPYPTYTKESEINTETSLPPTSTQSSLLFQDDFNSGLSPLWQLISGNPFIVNDKLTADRDTWFMVGENTWENYSVEFEADASDCWFSGSYNTIGIRVQDMNNMIAFRWADCESKWYIVDNGNWNEIPNSSFLHKLAAGWARIVVTFVIY